MNVVPMASVRGDGQVPELWVAHDQHQGVAARRQTVGQVLSDAGSRCVVPVVLDQRSRALLVRASSLPGNEYLVDLAARGQVDVDVSQLVHCDPAAEVIVGFELAWTDEEADLLDLHDRGPRG